MAYLSDDEVRALFYPERIKEKPFLFNGNRCTCGGVVSPIGVCFRCQYDHGQSLREFAERRNAQFKPRMSTEERLVLLASLFGQHCPDCHHGVLSEVGNCDFCDYRAQDHQ